MRATTCKMLNSFKQLSCLMEVSPGFALLLLMVQTYNQNCIKSVSMRKPGRTRQGVIMLKSPISLKLGTNVSYQELAYVTERQVKILNSLGDPGSPFKNRHFARLCIIN